jgi:AcrR family transcriptional regulator
MGVGAEEAAFLAAAVRREVARSSVRAVAKASGVSHGAIYNLATGKTRRVYGTTIGRLRDGYLRQWASGGDGLTPEVAAYLIEQVLAAIPPGARKDAGLDLVRSVELIYASRGAPRPAWLSAVRNDYGGEKDTE